MKIKDVTSDDLFKLAEIENKIFGVNSFGVYVLNEYLEKDTTLYFQKILNEKNEIIGFFIVSKLNKENYEDILPKSLSNINFDEYAHLDNIVLKEEYQNKGIGSYILKYLIDLLKKRGLFKIILEVSTENAKAIKLYTKNILTLLLNDQL